MEFAYLVERLYSAHRNFQQMHLRWIYTYNPAALATMMQRWQARYPSESISMMTVSSEQGLDVRQWVAQTQELWWERPSRWRHAHLSDNRQTIHIVNGNNHWWFDANRRQLSTNVVPLDQWRQKGISDVRLIDENRDRTPLEELPHLDPSFFLVSHELIILGQETYLQREMISVRAVYQKFSSHLLEDYFWSAADAYTLLVDAQTGLVLRYAAVLDGLEIAISKVEHLTLDAPISSDVFDPMQIVT